MPLPVRTSQSGQTDLFLNLKCGEVQVLGTWTVGFDFF